MASMTNPRTLMAQVEVDPRPFVVHPARLNARALQFETATAAETYAHAVVLESGVEHNICDARRCPSFCKHQPCRGCLASVRRDNLDRVLTYVADWQASVL